MRGTDTIRRRPARNWAGSRPKLDARGVVVSYPRGESENRHSHEAVTRRALAERLAVLKGYEYAGDYDAAGVYDGPRYLVPGETLVGLDTARALGILSVDDFFGGVVPFPFVGAKTITHPLIGAHAQAPEGWSGEFARSVRRAVLPGFSAFSREDAQVAGESLLARGAVRVKPALAIGGRGQVVAFDAAALSSALEAIDPHELETCGVVIEQNLIDVTTFSVGQVEVDDLVATYYGIQKLATDHGGARVYGGSDLTVARGDFDALLALPIEDGIRGAIDQARLYDAAARRCFGGFFASRRNYDVVRGRGIDGALQNGVLEQSWRIGGASGAEIAALEAFRADDILDVIRAECTEVYDEEARPPRNAVVHFRGEDPEVGFLTKFTVVEPHAYA